MPATHWIHQGHTVELRSRMGTIPARSPITRSSWTARQVGTVFVAMLVVLIFRPPLSASRSAHHPTAWSSPPATRRTSPGGIHAGQALIRD